MVADSVAASMPLLSIWILQVSYAGFVESKRPFQADSHEDMLAQEGY